MCFRTRSERALHRKPDGWLSSWDSLTRWLQTYILAELRQTRQPAEMTCTEQFDSPPGKTMQTRPPGRDAVTFSCCWRLAEAKGSAVKTGFIAVLAVLTATAAGQQLQPGREHIPGAVSLTGMVQTPAGFPVQVFVTQPEAAQGKLPVIFVAAW